jgi:hypothetical protein
MITMGKWYRKSGRLWYLLNTDQTLFAQVEHVSGGWVWSIKSETQNLFIANKLCKRSRKARRLAQRALAKWN